MLKRPSHSLQCPPKPWLHCVWVVGEGAIQLRSQDLPVAHHLRARRLAADNGYGQGRDRDARITKKKRSSGSPNSAFSFQ
jgi:hypothetical protein